MWLTINNLQLTIVNFIQKFLDVLITVFLLGKPILGHVKAFKPGHLANTEFVKMVIENLE